MVSPVWLSAKYQLLFVGIVAPSLAFWDIEVGYSFGLGCLVYVIPNLYFVHYAFRYRGAEEAQRIAQSVNWGESGKIALAALGFVLVYRFVSPLHHLSVFLGFFSMIVLQWFVAVRIVNRMATNQKQTHQ